MNKQLIVPHHVWILITVSLMLLILLLIKNIVAPVGRYIPDNYGERFVIVDTQKGEITAFKGLSILSKKGPLPIKYDIVNGDIKVMDELELQD